MGARRLPEQLSFGGRVPPVVGLLLAITVTLSLLVAFGDRHAGAIFQATALIPRAVWDGQIWRLVTWVFVQPDPIGLIFGCLFLYWFGSDLVRAWGSAPFLQLYSWIVLTASIVTCLIARVDEGVMNSFYLGGWSAAAGLTVAWGLTFPDRVIRIWFVLPIRGVVMAWLTVVVTVVFAIYRGWEHYVPELFAEATTFAWLYGGTITARWRKARAAAGARRHEAKQRDRAKKRAQSVEYLRLVEKNDDAPPDLPPEVDKKLDDILRGRSKRDRSFDN